MPSDAPPSVLLTMESEQGADVSEHPDADKIQQAPTSERRAALAAEQDPSPAPDQPAKTPMPWPPATTEPPTETKALIDPGAEFAAGFDPMCEACQDAAPNACAFHAKIPDKPTADEPEPFADDETLPATEEVARLVARVAWLEEALTTVVGELVSRNIVPPNYWEQLSRSVDRRLGGVAE